ncbi:hypothetical protein HT576_10425 [Haloterrigena sp. SYSU A121-1]|uniref:DUF2795 domain-containing protein n=1 Tax=Haloterrigena gelatinilytica TaxID=2741724 RepID=A0A8J8GN54_9EURY|nr:hypothetical protein [Haloterrigena gelatinilytica]NUB91432.1 hypothetical protein [Haloterrigena gelatinilytica]
MGRNVHLNDIESVLEELDYPVSRDAVADQCDDVTLVLADGEENLGELVAGSGADEFSSTDDLKSEVFNLLPRHAVGEPYQSEGEG